MLSGKLAKLVEEFSMNAYIKMLKSGGRDFMNTSLYGDDIFSHLVSGITFARFTLLNGYKKIHNMLMKTENILFRGTSLLGSVIRVGYRFSMPDHGWICRDESFRVYLDYNIKSALLH